MHMILARQARFGIVAAACVLLLPGCASYRWPRIDPTGQSVLIWPQQQGVPVATPPGAYGPPAVTFPNSSPAMPASPGPITGTPGFPPQAYPAQPSVQPPQTGSPPSPFTPPPAASPVPQPALLDIRVSGPDRAPVGTEVRFNIDITNRGANPLTGLVITDTFDQGLEHAISASPIQRELARLGPGETQSIGLTFRATRPGRLCHVVRVQTDTGAAQSATGCVLVESPVAARPSARLTVTARPTQARIGDTVDFAVEVTNTGTLAIPQMTLTDFIDPNLSPTDVAQGYTQLPNQFRWQISNLAPGKSIIYGVRCKCVGTPRACIRAELTDGAALSLSHEACVDIQPRDTGAPAAAR